MRTRWLTLGIVAAGVAAVTVVAVHRPEQVTGTASHAPLPASSTAGISATTPAAAPTSTVRPSTTRLAPPTTTTCARVIAKLPPRARLGQLFMVGVNPATPAGALALVRDGEVGGLFIGSNDPGLLTDGGVRRARSAATLPLFVGIDEEGGRVARVTGPHGKLPSARTMAATMSPAQVRTLATGLGAELRRLGVNVDFAPDTDVSDQPADAVIGDRSFSNSPGVVTTYAGAFAAGLRRTGVLPVLKHFPGHGHATGDSHTGAAGTPPLSSLLTDDLVPYRTLPNVRGTAVMVGHLDVPGLTGDVPSSLSPAAYRLLRQRYHFNGVVLTDDLGSMAAVTTRYPLPDAVLLAISAGADVALWTTGTQLSAVVQRLTSALADGTLSQARVNQAVTRVLIAKGVCTG
jgi:beta-N-acetylhexosaminidase